MKTINVEIEVPEGFDPVLCMKITNLAGQTPFNFRIVAAPEHPAAEVGEHRGLGAALYNAVNVMMAHLGADGEIDTRHRAVTAVMDALHDIDGGVHVALTGLSIGVDLLEDSEAPADYVRGFNDCLRAVAEDGTQPPTATPQQAKDEPSNEAVVSNWCKELVAALKRLSFAAQTSGGTAGRDDELCEAIAQAEKAMSIAAVGRALDSAEQQPAHLYRSDPDHGE